MPSSPPAAPSSGWAGATAYNRGQVLYRIAEMLEGRRAQFVDEIVHQTGVSAAVAAARSTRRSTAGSGTPAGATSSRRSPATATRSPDRTSTSRCPSRPASWRSSRRRAPALARLRQSSSPRRSSPATRSSSSRASGIRSVAISLAEVFATSDVPGGVVNVLTGSPAELAPWLASHADVNALDLVGAGDLDWVDLQIAAADTLKRVLAPEPGGCRGPERSTASGVHRDEDGLAHEEPGLTR